MARQHRDKEEILIMERATKVRQYRLIGFTQREIGQKLGISIDTVRRDIERIKVDFPEQAVTELIIEQDEKLREMMKPHYMKALKGDGKATDTMVKLLDHQAKLFGIYGMGSSGDSSQAVDTLKKFFGMLRDTDNGGASEA